MLSLYVLSVSVDWDTNAVSVCGIQMLSLYVCQSVDWDMNAVSISVYGCQSLSTGIQMLPLYVCQSLLIGI